MSEAQRLAASLRGEVADERVLAAIGAVPRERFVPAAERARAYENVALPIACGQTISQPLVVARMLELLALRPNDVALDVGTGSGYHAALLARLTRHVYTIERIAELAEQAREALHEVGVDNVTVIVGDGSAGLPDRAPFDVINVAAAGEWVPPSLERQLAPGGRLVAPVGLGRRQHLVRVTRTASGYQRERLEPVRFVPLLSGDAGDAPEGGEDTDRGDPGGG
jgi:protein-L-isoaspartate(D-aspartate) O-methyltransferase